MGLQARLDAIREASKTRLSPEIRSVMQGHIATLKTTGIADRVVIDHQGVIRDVDADPDYTRRPEPTRTVEILRGLT